MHLKNCVIYKIVLDDNFFNLLQMKKHILYLCHNYLRVPYIIHSRTFLQQLK